MSAMFAQFTQAVVFFDKVFEQCDLVNGLVSHLNLTVAVTHSWTDTFQMHRILATHPEGFDDAARKVYDTALANANRKVNAPHLVTETETI